MKRLIIGDIHGCFEELLDLLEAAGISDDDEVIALGDIVDRGPESPRVFNFFTTSAKRRSLMGNHERKHVRSQRGELRPALSQQITRRQFAAAEYQLACETMDRFPRHLDLPDALLVHGFYEPGIDIDQQQETVIVGTLTGEEKLRQKLNLPWHELYDGEKPLVVGHRDYLGTGQPLIVDDRVFAIDTGCCYGRRLTGLLLPDFRIVSVSSRRDYWTQLQDQHADLRYASTPDEQLTWDAAEKLAAQLNSPLPLPEETRQRAARVADLLQEGERAVSDLYRLLLQQHDATMQAIEADSAVESTSAKELAREYAKRVGTSPHARYLHQLRLGKLRVTDLRQRFKGPVAAIDNAVGKKEMSE